LSAKYLFCFFFLLISLIKSVSPQGMPAFFPCTARPLSPATKCPFNIGIFYLHDPLTFSHFCLSFSFKVCWSQPRRPPLVMDVDFSPLQKSFLEVTAFFGYPLPLNVFNIRTSSATVFQNSCQKVVFSRWCRFAGWTTLSSGLSFYPHIAIPLFRGSFLISQLS